MRAYFDTSALVPLLIEESATPLCTDAWNEAEVILSSAMTYVEVHAALAQAVRTGRIDTSAHSRGLQEFEVVWEDMSRIAVTNDVIVRAATMASSHTLRGYDAVHCATALAAASDDFVAVSGDQDLLRAWSALGIATIDTAR